MAKKSTTIKSLDDYIQVTRKNMKMALEIGSHFFLIAKKGKQFDILDVDCIRPRLRKGRISITNFPATLQRTSTVDIWIQDEETPEQYQSSHWAPMFEMIDAGKVYIHKTNRQKATFSLTPKQ